MVDALWVIVVILCVCVVWLNILSERTKKAEEQVKSIRREADELFKEIDILTEKCKKLTKND